MMADVSVYEDIVVRFLLNTWRLRPQHCDGALDGFANCIETSMNGGICGVDLIPLLTGSTAEFYIEPMLSCVGDIDIMFHLTNQLAIPASTTPPTQLPGDFDSVVVVFEIVDDGKFPGYVHLQLFCLLKECIEDSTYYAEQIKRKHIALYTNINKILENTYVNWNAKMHGPAYAFHNMLNRPFGLSLFYEPVAEFKDQDFVYCIRCLRWPSQAADWPLRYRINNWPDSITVARVINNGCDLVQVAHRQCRQNEWMSRYQHRLSFSRAEIILLNSWMPVQQIVYHMLRIFVKTGLTDSADDSDAETLSNYHIKTLMLWACELKPRSWWIDSLNVVGICVQLLHTLAVWLTDARCQHYFINNCNLFDHVDNWRLIASRLTSVTKASLAEWFIGKYIFKCARQHCPAFVFRLFDDVSSNLQLQNAVSAVVIWRVNASILHTGAVFTFFQQLISSYVSQRSLTALSCTCWIRELAKMTSRCPLVYFTAITFLHVAYKITKDSLTYELLDILFITCLQSNNRRRCINARPSSVLSLSQAAKLMKVVANDSSSTVQLIEIELSKAYLHRALRCKDSDSDSVYCLANVYLAVLYYTTGQYQTAIDHCTLVTRSQDHSQCSSHVVQGELLPKIGDNVDTVLGLATFYHYVRAAALNQQRQHHHVSVFTTELFAHYLHIKCLSVGNSHQLTQPSLSAGDIQRYQKCLCEFQEIFITDILTYVQENNTSCRSDWKGMLFLSIKLRQLDVIS